MTTKIDVRMIVSDHFATFKDEGTGRASASDFVVMVGIPLTASLLAILFDFQIKDSYVGTLVSVFAIFAGLLFNVLVLIYSFSDEEDDDKKSIRNNLIRQSFANISYSIIISLGVVFLLTLMLFVGGIAQKALEVVVIFLAVNFFLSLLMVLKRIHVLLRDKFGG
ncbi:MAG: hypothetical protein K5872_04605 [Rhizobiaceae bacterium]|nr:hypothetical protein [Rhizobiaceae bacterium]MCV0405491.1 hypothetical protein [Rhizobiaceae bacterium]